MLKIWISRVSVWLSGDKRRWISVRISEPEGIVFIQVAFEKPAGKGINMEALGRSRIMPKVLKKG
jgi:hypothetical protein